MLRAGMSAMRELRFRDYYSSVEPGQDLHDGDHVAVCEDNVHDAAGKEDWEV